MSSTNAELELIGKGLTMLHTVLLTFVNSKMIRQYGDDWLNNGSVRNILRRSNPNQVEYSLDDLDISLLLNIIDNNNIWEDAFDQTLVNTTILTSIHQSQLVSVRNIRNRYAHQCVANSFLLYEVEETLFKMQNIVEFISPDDVNSFRKLRQSVSYLRDETGSTKVGINIPNNDETLEAPHLDDEIGFIELESNTANSNKNSEMPYPKDETGSSKVGKDTANSDKTPEAPYSDDEIGSNKVNSDTANNDKTPEAPHSEDKIGFTAVDDTTGSDKTPEAPHPDDEQDLDQLPIENNSENVDDKIIHKPQEVVSGTNNNTPPNTTSTFNLIAKLSLTIIAMFSLGVVVAIKSFQSFSVNNASMSLAVNSTEKVAKYRLQAKSLKIGILGNPKDYNELESHLRSQFGNNIQITIDGDNSISYTEARNRIIRKEWDIAFTLSPMLSVAAKNNGYTYVAQMFPDNPPYYQAALFVKSNSSIKSLNDLKPSHTIALGDFNSASSFYMPAYDLFGKTLRVDEGNSSQAKFLVLLTQ